VQRLMSKRTKTKLPVAQHLLEPEIQSDVERKLTKKRRMPKKYFDQGSKELPELENWSAHQIDALSIRHEQEMEKRGVH